MNPLRSFLGQIDQALTPLRSFADCVGQPLLLLAARLYLAYTFFAVGWLRLQDLLNDSWENQVYLFTDEHPVPGLSGEIAAALGMGGELGLSVLVALGLFSRFGAAGLLVMIAVIELTYQHADDHILWAFLALLILVRGAGWLSLDHWLLRWIRR